MRKRKYVGSVTIGVALAGIPYIVLVAMIDFSSYEAISTTNENLLFLVPFIFVINANLVLMLTPDLYGETILFRSIQSYKSLFNNNPIAIISIDLNGNIVNVNNEAVPLTGYTKKELMKMSIYHFCETKKEEIKRYLTYTINGGTQNIETRLIKKDGSYSEVRITIVKTIIKGKLMGLFGIIEDITEKKQAENKIKYLAYHDDLTTLPNRRMADLLMRDLSREGKPFAIMLIDFDRFKRINDSFGHAFGDLVLQLLGRELLGIKKKYSEITITRIGGDEFLIILKDENYKKVAIEIVNHFKNPLIVNGYEILLTASMGVSIYLKHTKNLNELLKYADIAMYEKKNNGANGFMEYIYDMDKPKEIQFNLENDLRNALKEGTLMIYYQPKYNIIQDALTGSEALLRWKHPTKGMISPGIFIPLAEDSGMIIQVERYVIEKVCHQFVSWREKGKKLRRVSINISLESLLQEDFTSYISSSLKEFNLNGDLFEFEITERMVMKNEEYVNSILQELRYLGVKISIDDFGTGYSSLSYLHKLHVDSLKIDKSFVEKININRSVIISIISMAKSFDLHVIAEGVETKEQMEILRELGCEEIQGYYYSRPIPSNELQNLL